MVVVFIINIIAIMVDGLSIIIFAYIYYVYTGRNIYRSAYSETYTHMSKWLFVEKYLPNDGFRKVLCLPPFSVSSCEIKLGQTLLH